MLSLLNRYLLANGLSQGLFEDFDTAVAVNSSPTLPHPILRVLHGLDLSRMVVERRNHRFDVL